VNRRFAVNTLRPTRPRSRRFLDRDIRRLPNPQEAYDRSARRLGPLYRALAATYRELSPMNVPCSRSESHVQATTTTQLLSFVASHTLLVKKPPPPIPRPSEVVSSFSHIASAILDGRWCVPVPTAGDGPVLLSAAQSTSQPQKHQPRYLSQWPKAIR
jgi:hypothetical protein